MFSVLMPILLTVATGQVSTEKDFAVLEKRKPKSSALKQACERIDKAFPDGDEACIKRLVSIWADNQWSQKQSILLACRKANDKTCGIILGAVRKAAAAADNEHKRRRLSSFFGKPAFTLCSRLTDPEPLLMLVLEYHRWPTIVGLDCSQALKEKYLVKGLLLDDSEKAGGFGSLAHYVSDEAIPSLRKAMRELAPKGYMSEPFQTAMQTLVDLSDTKIIPDLEVFARNPKLLPQQRIAFQSHLVKLKHQHSPDDLMKVIENQREDMRTLKYAALRYLWLTKDAQTVREALEKNQRKSTIVGHNIAQWTIEYLFEYKGPVISAEKFIPERKYDIPLYILDHDEFREYQKQSKVLKDKDSDEYQRWSQPYSIEGIVQAATKSQPESEKEKPQPVSP